MKSFYAILMFFVDAVLLGIIFHTFKMRSNSASRIISRIRTLLIFAVCAVSADIAVLLSKNADVAVISYGIFFSSFGWISVTLLDFAVEYAFPGLLERNDLLRVLRRLPKNSATLIENGENAGKTRTEIFFFLCFVVIVLDTVSFLMNVGTRQLFDVALRPLNDSEFYYVFVPNAVYYIHLYLCYVLLASCFIMLIYKTAVSPSIYKTRYISIIMLITLGVVLDAFFLIYKTAFDISILAFGFIGIGIYYVAMFYVPHTLKVNALELVADKMKNGLVIFDAEDNCIYMNDFIKSSFCSIMTPSQFVEELVIKQWGGGKKPSCIEMLEESNSGVRNATVNLQKDKLRDVCYSIMVDGSEMKYKVIFQKITESGKVTESESERKSQRLLNEVKEELGSYFIVLDVTQEMKALEKEHYLASHDSLTGIYTGEYFYKKVRQVLDYAPPDEKYVMLCANIYRFKLINDLYGREFGDQLLIRIAREMAENAKPGDIYGRLDNDRFAYFVPKKHFDESVFVEKISKLLQAASTLQMSLVCYMGIYEIDDADMHVSVMCDRAFLALESIKGDFARHIARYDASFHENALKEQEFVHQLYDSIDDNQIVMYLQPQFTKDGKVIGAEALARWNHPEKGIIPPSEFIPLFEKTGQIITLDCYLWRQACKKLVSWRDKGFQDLFISVNIAARDFYLCDIFEVFKNLVEEYDLPPSKLKLEITEAAIMMDMERQQQIIEKLRKYGFSVGMDDFGSSHSSLGLLKEMWLDDLKLDMSFLSSSEDKERSRTIIKNMINMLKNIGINVVTEGVENLEQVEFLSDSGCDVYQGYYFSRPLPVDKFEEKYIGHF